MQQISDTLFLRVLQQLASRVQAVLRDELREGHPLAPLEIRAGRRAAHPRLRRDVVQRRWDGRSAPSRMPQICCIRRTSRSMRIGWPASARSDDVKTTGSRRSIAHQAPQFVRCRPFRTNALRSAARAFRPESSARRSGRRHPPAGSAIRETPPCTAPPAKWLKATIR